MTFIPIFNKSTHEQFTKLFMNNVTGKEVSDFNHLGDRILTIEDRDGWIQGSLLALINVSFTFPTSVQFKKLYPKIKELSFYENGFLISVEGNSHMYLYKKETIQKLMKEIKERIQDIDKFLKNGASITSWRLSEKAIEICNQVFKTVNVIFDNQDIVDTYKIIFRDKDNFKRLLQGEFHFAESKMIDRLFTKVVRGDLSIKVYLVHPLIHKDWEREKLEPELVDLLWDMGLKIRSREEKDKLQKILPEFSEEELEAIIFNYSKDIPELNETL